MLQSTDQTKSPNPIVPTNPQRTAQVIHRVQTGDPSLHFPHEQQKKLPATRPSRAIIADNNDPPGEMSMMWQKSPGLARRSSHFHLQVGAGHHQELFDFHCAMRSKWPLCDRSWPSCAAVCAHTTTPCSSPRGGKNEVTVITDRSEESSSSGDAIVASL